MSMHEDADARHAAAQAVSAALQQYPLTPHEQQVVAQTTIRPAAPRSGHHRSAVITMRLYCRPGGGIEVCDDATNLSETYGLPDEAIASACCLLALLMERGLLRAREWAGQLVS